jgi:hypothetical protein
VVRQWSENGPRQVNALPAARAARHSEFRSTLEGAVMTRNVAAAERLFVP